MCSFVNNMRLLVERVEDEEAAQRFPQVHL